MSADISRIRNFSIIAHIDHGKSTLADRILSVTGALTAREEKEQFLDRMELERERGITIKAQTVRLPYTAEDGTVYQLNLIDTPGHVDFHYEVSRSLQACEGAILIVDATQGVEAQTLANVYLALENDLEIIPVFNKIDLPGADVDRAKHEVEDVIGLDTEDGIAASGKTGAGVPAILEAIIARIPPPKTDPSMGLRALIVDSWYDTYRGAMVMVRVVDGRIQKGQKIKMMATGAEYEVTEIGVFNPFPVSLEHLGAGEVGFISASIKSIHDTKVGDTLTDARTPASEPLPGFKDVKPMVFCGIFPTDNAQYGELRDALDKLHLNDSAFVFEPDTSEALGFGFRCGFLGLLHMDVIQERLEREYNLDLITTAPSVVYHVYTADGEKIEVENPSKLPDPQIIERIEEPYFRVSIHVPASYTFGAVLKLCEDRRGEQHGIQYASQERVIITYDLPLGEVLFDFFDKLKSATKGYASMDYELEGYRPNKLVRLDMLVNGDKVDALSAIVHREKSYFLGRKLAEKLKGIVPRQQYEVAIQAAIGNKIIARETIRALRKDVTAKCYGGDISRKRKLLEKQKEGKRRMKSVGRVDIPQDAFHAILKVE